MSSSETVVARGAWFSPSYIILFLYLYLYYYYYSLPAYSHQFSQIKFPSNFPNYFPPGRSQPLNTPLLYFHIQVLAIASSSRCRKMIINHTCTLNNATGIYKLPRGFYHWLKLFESTNSDTLITAQIVDSETKPTSITSGQKIVILTRNKGISVDSTPDGVYLCESPWLIVHTAGNFTINCVYSFTQGEQLGVNFKTNKR